jgi:hypothetical protein
VCNDEGDIAEIFLEVEHVQAEIVPLAIKKKNDSKK